MNRATAGAQILLGVCLTAMVAAGAWAATSPPPAAPPPADQAALIAKGKYLATAGDCISCHTAPGGQPMAGGLGMDTPFGKIYTPNITPDKQTGIGNWTDAQFYRALHDGIGGHGQYLYPAMPFPWYTKVTHDDVMAIKAYIFSVAPVHAPDKPNGMAFPFNIREGLLAWRLAFFTEGTFKPDPSKSAQLNRGAYLVQGLGHCGECHNNENLFGASAAAGRLQGGAIDNWYAPNITGDTLEGVGAWSQDELATFLKTGAAPQAGAGVALGPMAETIHNSLQYLTDDDIQAIAAYLKAVPGKATYQESKLTPNETGANVYLSFCASCHQQNGKGVPGEIPALAGNGAVKAREPDNVIRVVLGGLTATKTYAPMPALGAGMTDAEVAAVTNYVRTAWGNGAPANAQAGLVGKLRGDTHTLMAVDGTKGCPAVKDPDVAKAVTAPQNPFTPALQGVTDANLLQTVDAMIPKLKAAAPHTPTADLVNGMVAAYCPILLSDKQMNDAQRAARIGTFAEIMYGQLVRTTASN
jgi:mono/diheme cytochrome c family protein